MSTKHVAKIVEIPEWEEEDRTPPARQPAEDDPWRPEDARDETDNPIPVDRYLHGDRK